MPNGNAAPGGVLPAALPILKSGAHWPVPMKGFTYLVKLCAWARTASEHRMISRDTGRSAPFSSGARGASSVDYCNCSAIAEYGGVLNGDMAGLLLKANMAC